MLNIALPKGRLGEKVYGMFERAGFECPSIREENRRLFFENETLGLRYFWVKPSDVAIYVARGAADIGVAGKDILLEYRPDVYELLDLGVGKCRMCVAGPKDFRDDLSKTLRVATKFSHIATDYYTSIGRDIDVREIINLSETMPFFADRRLILVEAWRPARPLKKTISLCWRQSCLSVRGSLPTRRALFFTNPGSKS